jgi:hypothetical protein
LKNFDLDVSSIDQKVLDVFTDIMFNSGTKSEKNAIKAYKEGSINGLVEAIKNGSVTSPSKQRKDFRLDILQKGVYKFVDSGTQPAASTSSTPSVKWHPPMAAPESTPTTPSLLDYINPLGTKK